MVGSNKIKYDIIIVGREHREAELARLPPRILRRFIQTEKNGLMATI